MRSQRKTSPRILAFIAMLGVLSAVLMLISVPLPFAPSFLRFDIAENPALFAGFFLGPAGGCAVILMKILLKLLFQGTDTAYVGELMNLVGSSAFVLTASLIYKFHRTRRGAVAGLAISTVLVSVVFIFLNAYVAFPMYASLYGLPMEAIIGMGSAANPLIRDTVTLMLYAVFPFNLLKHAATSVITYLIYKRCGNALRSVLRVETPTPHKGGAAA